MLALAVLVGLGCGSNRYELLSRTQVMQGEHVATGQADLDRYLRAVHSIQHALGAAEARRMESLTILARGIGQPANADTDALANALQTWLDQHRVTAVQVTMPQEDQEFEALREALARWTVAVFNGTGDDQAARFAQVEAALDVRFGAGGPPEDVARLSGSLAPVLRRARALYLTMRALVLPTDRLAELQARGHALLQRAPERWRQELAAADLQLDGVEARARARMSDSQRTERALRSAAASTR